MTLKEKIQMTTGKTPTMLPLCYRCEHRAVFLEEGYGPRYECQQPGAIIGCYAYRPVCGLVLRRDKGDRRSIGAPDVFSARSHAVGIAPGEYVRREVKGGVVIYYEGGNGGEGQTCAHHGGPTLRRSHGTPAAKAPKG